MEKSPVVQPNANIIKAFSITQSAVEKNLADVTPVQQAQPQQQLPPPPKAVPLPQTQPESQPPQPKKDQDIELQKQAKLQKQKELEKALKQQMLTEQAKEAQTLKKELIIKQKAQEKQILHNAFTDELSKEDKQLEKNTKRLAATATTNTKISNATSADTQNTPADTQAQGEIDKYKALIIQAISQEWIVPDDIDKNTSCKLLINLGPGGVVLRVQVVQASNNPLLDRSAQNAVWKASPLPIPKDNNLLDNFRSIQLTVRPEEIVSQ